MRNKRFSQSLSVLIDMNGKTLRDANPKHVGSQVNGIMYGECRVYGVKELVDHVRGRREIDERTGDFGPRFESVRYLG